jgi:hypothetical protein
MSDHASPAPHPDTRAVETIGQAVGDLIRLCERLPLTDPGECETAAELLDQISTEIRQAAAFVRAGAVKPATICHYPGGWIS